MRVWQRWASCASILLPLGAGCGGEEAYVAAKAVLTIGGQTLELEAGAEGLAIEPLEEHGHCLVDTPTDSLSAGIASVSDTGLTAVELSAPRELLTEADVSATVDGKILSGSCRAVNRDIYYGNQPHNIDFTIIGCTLSAGSESGTLDASFEFIACPGN